MHTPAGTARPYGLSCHSERSEESQLEQSKLDKCVGVGVLACRLGCASKLRLEVSTGHPHPQRPAGEHSSPLQLLPQDCAGFYDNGRFVKRPYDVGNNLCVVPQIRTKSIGFVRRGELRSPAGAQCAPLRGLCIVVRFVQKFTLLGAPSRRPLRVGAKYRIIRTLYASPRYSSKHCPLCCISFAAFSPTYRQCHGSYITPVICVLLSG